MIEELEKLRKQIEDSKRKYEVTKEREKEIAKTIGTTPDNVICLVGGVVLVRRGGTVTSHEEHEFIEES